MNEQLLAVGMGEEASHRQGVQNQLLNSPDWELEKSISLKLSRMAFLSLIPRSIDYNRFMQLLKDFPSFVTLVIRNMHMFGV